MQTWKFQRQGRDIKLPRAKDKGSGVWGCPEDTKGGKTISKKREAS